MKIETCVPIVSVKSLVSLTSAADNSEVQETSNLLLNAAKEWGFVFIENHGVPHALLEELETLSREFFELPLSKKMKIKMSLGGKAWRGYFPPGNELTSGIPDAKEGIYFGTELDENDPKGKQGTPLHGPNLWPHDDIPKLRPIILEYLSRLTELGHALMRGFAIGLNLDENYFKKLIGTDPIILFRIFNYPQSDQKEGWGVGGKMHILIFSQGIRL
jgi:isopenicillin N synthase-like dioxygenase